MQDHGAREVSAAYRCGDAWKDLGVGLVDELQGAALRRRRSVVCPDAVDGRHVHWAMESARPVGPCGVEVGMGDDN